MSIEKVKAYFDTQGMLSRVMEFEVSSATVALAAQALGCAPELIAKTLSFEAGDSAILILAAGDARIDNAKFKARFGMKAKMLGADKVEPLIGHGIGGVCPFGVNEGIPVYLDESLRRFEHVYPAAGTSSSAVYLSLEELERASEALGWVNVSK
jgi:prolyl-tRNA editing enzyme YbaK/EbsC (Cys-tRNA(Pro) deacylase)